MICKLSALPRDFRAHLKEAVAVFMNESVWRVGDFKAKERGFLLKEQGHMSAGNDHRKTGKAKSRFANTSSCIIHFAKFEVGITVSR